MDSPDFLLDAFLEPGPALLPAEGLQSPVDPVLHHGDELLVAQQPVAVVVENLWPKRHVLPRGDKNGGIIEILVAPSVRQTRA